MSVSPVVATQPMIQTEATVRVPEPVAIAPPPAPVPVLVPPPIASTADVSELQRLVVDALGAAKQSAAADAMGDAAWTLANGEASVQTDISKTMLPHVMNPEAEKVARAALRAAGVMKFTLLAGAAKAAADKKPKVARSGSAQAKAMEHPMVQQARKLFDAEIQTVIDLSGKD
jgi:DNA polymerase-3 subunit gamma/tau